MDSTQRFTSRVGNYVRYRPSYPTAIVATLESTCGLGAASLVADVGSGTGILAAMLLQCGCTVYGVEPNAAMRRAAEDQLGAEPGFHSVDGTAEHTTLLDHSIDIITAGQAFHWFNPQPTRQEWARILRPNGWVALVWNERQAERTPFGRAYERMLETYGLDYVATKHTNIDVAVIGAFFSPHAMQTYSFPNNQQLSFEQLRGRLESSSYTPPPDHPNHAPMIAELARIFAAHQVDGSVVFEYDTVLYISQWAG